MTPSRRSCCGRQAGRVFRRSNLDGVCRLVRVVSRKRRSGGCRRGHLVKAPRGRADAVRCTRVPATGTRVTPYALGRVPGRGRCLQPRGWRARARRIAPRSRIRVRAPRGAPPAPEVTRRKSQDETSGQLRCKAPSSIREALSSSKPVCDGSKYNGQNTQAERAPRTALSLPPVCGMIVHERIDSTFA